MAVVTDLRENRGIMEISLDGVLWLKIRKKHFALNPLEAGECIDPEQYLDRSASMQASDCYESALTMLDQAAQTSGDLRLKLMRKGYVEPAAQAVVDRLVSNGLIDDARYAERVAHGQLNKAVGAYAVRRKLMAKRLPEEAIEAAMEEFDGEQQAQACREAAQKLWRKYSALPRREGRAKLSQALARRGFSWNVISTSVDELVSESWDD